MAKWLTGIVVVVALVALCMGAQLSVAYAATNPNSDTLQSSHYQFVESSLGNGGLLHSSSPNFVLGESIGDAAVGNSSSGNFQVNAGSKTTADPSLTFSINNGTPSFGSFSPAATATATSTFQVLDYTSYGYTVQIIGTPPTYKSHTIAPMTSTGPPQIGTEQFGINLVANTVPKVFGADPDNGQFGFGEAADNYKTPNQYRYVSGETIVKAPKSSGTTTYTISYIVNVNSLTPGGDYVSNQVLICVATY